MALKNCPCVLTGSTVHLSSSAQHIVQLGHIPHFLSYFQACHSFASRNSTPPFGCSKCNPGSQTMPVWTHIIHPVILYSRRSTMAFVLPKTDIAYYQTARAVQIQLLTPSAHLGPRQSADCLPISLHLAAPNLKGRRPRELFRTQLSQNHPKIL